MAYSIGPALTQYAADYMRQAQDRAEKARGAAEAAAEKAESAKVYADDAATNFEFFEPVINVETYRCPKCWVESREDSPLQSADGGAFHCDACGKNFSPELGVA